MTPPGTAREALIAEAIGDLARLLDRIEAIVPALDGHCGALQRASTRLDDQLGNFERRLAAMTEQAKVYLVRHVAGRTDEAARRSIALQAQAMADAARVAFGSELGTIMKRLQALSQALLERRESRWESWLTHAAAAAVASAATWGLTLYLGRC